MHSKGTSLALANIPQILDILVEYKVINANQIQPTLDYARDNRTFAGEAGVRLGYYDTATLTKYLLEQTTRKAEAAVKDMQTIINCGTQATPSWLVANWGNNGVNPAAANPTIADGVAAAANIAQNIVMISNIYPPLAKTAQEAVVAAANIARGIVNGSSAVVPLDKKAGEWMKELQVGLTSIVKASGYIPLDRQKEPKPINLEDFISERTKEIQNAISLSLAKQSTTQKEIAK